MKRLITSCRTDKLENIVPACRSCNSKKGTLTLDEFLEKFR
ncbi:HNH endonuclease [Psychrobacillus sp. NPDC058041]